MFSLIAFDYCRTWLMPSADIFLVKFLSIMFFFTTQLNFLYISFFLFDRRVHIDYLNIHSLIRFLETFRRWCHFYIYQERFKKTRGKIPEGKIPFFDLLILWFMKIKEKIRHLYFLLLFNSSAYHGLSSAHFSIVVTRKEWDVETLKIQLPILSYTKPKKCFFLSDSSSFFPPHSLFSIHRNVLTISIFVLEAKFSFCNIHMMLWHGMAFGMREWG